MNDTEIKTGMKVTVDPKSPSLWRGESGVVVAVGKRIQLKSWQGSIFYVAPCDISVSE